MLYGKPVQEVPGIVMAATAEEAKRSTRNRPGLEVEIVNVPSVPTIAPVVYEEESKLYTQTSVHTIGT
jgi:hypothetical protein